MLKVSLLLGAHQTRGLLAHKKMQYQEDQVDQLEGLLL